MSGDISDAITFPMAILGISDFGKFMLVRQCYEDLYDMIVSNTPPTPFPTENVEGSGVILDVADTCPKATPAISGTTDEVVKPAKVPIQVEEYYNHVIIGTPGK